MREAFFGPHPVAHLVIACRGDRIVGMGQWTRIYDMFWSIFGGEMLHGGSEADGVTQLYERVARGSPARTCYVSGEAFHAFADLAGKPARDIVRLLPDATLNHEPPRPRSHPKEG